MSLVSKSGRVWLLSQTVTPAAIPLSTTTTLFPQSSGLPFEPQFDHVRVLGLSISVFDANNTGKLQTVGAGGLFGGFGVIAPSGATVFAAVLASDHVGNAVVLDDTGFAAVGITDSLYNIDAIANKVAVPSTVVLFAQARIQNTDGAAAHAVSFFLQAFIELVGMH